MNDKIKVCAYARVSTNSQDQNNSYENQKSYFERELSKNENYEFVGIYADRGISGLKLHREKFNEMLIDAGLDIKEVFSDDRRKMKYMVIESNREPKFHRIFVKNTSRFARNIEVVGILRDLKKKGVFVHFMDIGKTTENNDDMTYIEIFLSFDERDSIDKSKKVKFGMNEGAAQGKLFTNGKLYGYRYIKEENRLEIIEDEAKVVSLVFQMYSEGYGLRIIESFLKENKIFNLRTGLPFNKASLNNMLKNPKYAGINAAMMWDTGEIFNTTWAKMKNKEHWVINKDSEKIPAIISEELYNKCEEMRNNKINTIAQKGKKKVSSKYAGIIKCGICGANYSINSNRGRVFYNCSNKKAHGIKACNSPNLDANYLEEQFTKMCNGEYNKVYSMYKEYVIYYLEKIKDLIGKRIDNDKFEEVQKNKKEVEKLNSGLERLLDLFLNLEIEKDVFTERSSSIKEKIETLQFQIEKDSRGNDQLITDINNIDNTIYEMNTFKLKPKYTREEILQELVYIEISKSMELDTDKIKSPKDIIKRFYDTYELDKPCVSFIFKWINTYSDIVQKYYDLV